MHVEWHVSVQNDFLFKGVNFYISLKHVRFEELDRNLFHDSIMKSVVKVLMDAKNV